MLRRAGKHAGERGADCGLHFLEQLRPSERLPRHDQRAFRAPPFELPPKRFDFAGAENHRLEPGEMIFAKRLVHFIPHSGAGAGPRPGKQ